MADLTIPQIPADAADANLRAGDKLLANRAGVDVSAIVPNYAELTNGKIAASALPDNLDAPVNLSVAANLNDIPIPANKTLTKIRALIKVTISNTNAIPNQFGAAFSISWRSVDTSNSNQLDILSTSSFNFDVWSNITTTSATIYKIQEFAGNINQHDDAELLYVNYNSSLGTGFNSNNSITVQSLQTILTFA